MKSDSQLMAAGVKDKHFQLTIAQINKFLPTHMQATLTECNELQKKEDQSPKKQQH